MRISDNIQDLTGIGDEILVDRETYTIIAKFYNGRLVTGLSVEKLVGNTDITKGV